MERKMKKLLLLGLLGLIFSTHASTSEYAGKTLYGSYKAPGSIHPRFAKPPSNLNFSGAILGPALFVTIGGTGSEGIGTFDLKGANFSKTTIYGGNLSYIGSKTYRVKSGGPSASNDYNSTTSYTYSNESRAYTYSTTTEAFSGAIDLTSANFSGATIKNLAFGGTLNFIKAHFTGAKIEAGAFSGRLNFCGAIFTNATIQTNAFIANNSTINFSKTTILLFPPAPKPVLTYPGQSSIGSLGRQSLLTNQKTSTYTPATFTNATLQAKAFTAKGGGTISFEGVSFKGTKILNGTFYTEGKGSTIDLSGADFTGALLWVNNKFAPIEPLTVKERIEALQGLLFKNGNIKFQGIKGIASGLPTADYKKIYNALVG
jgi:uncharacterized protein YjbI with pentapeptide repeats